jgi:metallo-beta-lactamase family protein
VYDLHVLYRSGSIPAIPIFIDSPLAVDTTTVFAQHPELFDESENLVQQVTELFQFDLVHFTRKAEESKALNSARGPMIIIAASGMAEAGRILHHLAHGAADPRNTILIVGFQAEHTLGRRIVERRETIKVFGDDIPLRARVEIINGYSAHADRTELARWLAGVRAKSPKMGAVSLVHGEVGPQDMLAAELTKSGYAVECPTPGSVRTL